MGVIKHLLMDHFKKVLRVMLHTQTILQTADVAKLLLVFI